MSSLSSEATENATSETAASIPEAVKVDPPTRRILMPVDTSIHGDRSLRWFAEHMGRPGDMLLLLHIVEPGLSSITNRRNSGKRSKSVCYISSPLKSGNKSTGSEDFSQALHDHLSSGKSLGSHFQELAKEMDLKIRFTLHIGSKPGEHICRIAQSESVSMVVMGNRGMHGCLRRTLLGSVTDYVVHHIQIPVVLIPPLQMLTPAELKKASSDANGKVAKKSII